LILTVPVAEPSEFNEPIIMSPSATPVKPKLPVVASATLCAETVAEVNAAVPKLTAVSFGPLAPIWSVPVVAKPVLLIVAEAIVPSVAVPVEAVRFVPKVAGPDANRVPIVAVPVDAVRLDPKVTAPESIDAPSTEKDPVLLTPVVLRDRAEDVLSPSVITCNEPSRPPVVNVLISWA
jgi:hypothetical protein